MRKEYDLSNAKRARDVPHLVKLQAELKGKTRITIMLDNFVIKAFREMAEKEGIGYQTLINRTLRNKLQNDPVTEDTLRKVLRDEMGAYRK